MRGAALALLGVLAVVGCEGQTPPQTARQVLTTFCSLHRADLFNLLLTETQRAAATQVCAAIGLRLGSD